MVAVPSTCNLKININRHWEDYKTLKKFWSYKAKFLREYTFHGSVTSTAALAELKDGSDATIAFLGANDIVYIRSEADLAALDGDSIWIDYVSSTGTLYENIESKLDSATSTDTEVPIGCESGTYVDAVAAVNGDTLTMTALDESANAANRLAGWYVVASGDAADMEGSYLTILSNTAANPTVITCTTTPNANWNGDNVSVQRTLNNDVYRIRQIRSETEAPADNLLCVCDKDKTNIYAVIPDGNSQSNHPRYFALSSSYRCFIGRIHAQAPLSVGTDGDNLEFEIKVTYTPKAWDNPDTSLDSQVGCDISQTFSFTDEFLWEPCIELEPCTEVIIYVRKVIDQDHSFINVDFDMLEVTL